MSVGNVSIIISGRISALFIKQTFFYLGLETKASEITN